MKFIVGIGNPGKSYERTRHNSGFQVLDRLALKLCSDSGTKFKWDKDRKLKTEIKICPVGGLAKPATFVNLSGESVLAIVKKNHCAPKDLLIVCDDVNLAFGKLRLRESGSAGGHHGLESIIEHLGSEEFPRLRVGVGNDKMPKDLTSFVLEAFSPAEKKDLEKIFEKAVSVCETWLSKGFEFARDQLSQLQSVK